MALLSSERLPAVEEAAYRLNSRLYESDVQAYYSKLISIKTRVNARYSSLAVAIQRRNLYFRVSIVGNCNFSCQFCHNEGGPTIGRLALEKFEQAVLEAKTVGFKRVQLTGGEPLLRNDIRDFISTGRRHFDDVGLTTNGSLLSQRIPKIVGLGLTRVHISLQAESLIFRENNEISWRIPEWLNPSIEALRRDSVNVRLNVPIASDDLSRAQPFLQQLMVEGLSAKVFSILPTQAGERYPIERLTDMVNRINRAILPSSDARITLRDYAAPVGLRCCSCSERSSCAESSRSLRLGSDLMFRPCLATREWDRLWGRGPLCSALEDSAYMALDW